MSRRFVRAALFFVLLTQLTPSAAVSSGEQKPDPAALEKAARDALVKFDKGLKEYTNEPNLGDPGWKMRMEALVQLVRAGPAAVPLLEEAVKKESPAAQAFATHVLAVIRGPEAIRKSVTNYDLAKLDSARLGQVAPDFSLTDLSGKGYRLSQFRDKKAVILTFFTDDG